MNGPFGNRFPYTNFHEMNLDWMIQIAKDFLDQYTHIQETIEQGLTDIGEKTDAGLADLQDKYEALEGLLQDWYNEHSEDIAGQLADALEDLNSWYTTHEGYLDQYVTDSISAFNTAAEQKTAACIASIPADYSDLSSTVLDLDTAICEEMNRNISISQNGLTGSIAGTNVEVSGTATAFTSVQVINSLVSPELFRLNSMKGKKLHFKLKFIDPHEHIDFVFAYKATSGASWIELLRVDSRDILTGDYLGYFTMPSSFYQFTFTLSFYNAWVYNSNFVMSLQNTDVVYKLADDADARENTANIKRLEQKVADSNFGFTKYYAADGSTTQDDITIVKNGSEVIFNGQPSVNGVFNLMQDSRAFKGGETFYINYDTNNTGLYLQVDVIETVGGPSSNILTENYPGCYKVTVPDPVALVTVKITYLSIKTYEYSTVNVLITNYNSMENRIFRTSEFNDSIIATVKEAQRYYGSIVLLDSSSTYDMVADFVNYYGAGFFEHYTPVTADGYGLVLTNGITIKGYANTVIECDPSDYITDDNKIYLNFSPFMMGGGDCTIESVTINCISTKYCIHDDWGFKAARYRHIIRNCKLYHTGSGLRCIGGGFTTSSECIIEGCYFRAANESFPVHYHNNGSNQSFSKLYITNNYFLNGGIGLANYGPSVDKSIAYISNNSYMNDPVIEFLDQGTYPNVNMEYIAWNNENR